MFNKKLLIRSTYRPNPHTTGVHLDVLVINQAARLAVFGTSSGKLNRLPSESSQSL